MIGQTVSHYRILRSLGAGGMGEVYLAEDTKLGPPGRAESPGERAAGDPDRRARFEREARAIAALNHPASSPSTRSKNPEAASSSPWSSWKAGRWPIHPAAGMPLAYLLKVAIPLADALGTAHQRGIIHRDLKPANVMIGRRRAREGPRLRPGQAASGGDRPGRDRAAADGARHRRGQDSRHRRVHVARAGAGKPVDHRSDIFSLGVVLFEMATGQRPFKGDSSVSVLSSVLRDTPPLVSELKPELPRELGRIIRHCLSRIPRSDTRPPRISGTISRRSRRTATAASSGRNRSRA